MKGRPKLARKRRQCAEISICRLCLVALSIIIPTKEVFLCLVALSIIIPPKEVLLCLGLPRAQPCWFALCQWRAEKSNLMIWLSLLPCMLAFDPFATYAGFWSFWHICWPLILLTRMLAFDPFAIYAGLWSFCYVCCSLILLLRMLAFDPSATYAGL